jgi:hypothetical protein
MQPLLREWGANMDDLATDKPGPMGWGIDEDRLKVEQRLFGELSESDPVLFSRNPIREPLNQPLLDKIKAEQAKDGIEGGLSLRHIEHVVFGGELRWLKQLIGSCVGSAGMRCTARRMLWESFVLGDAEEIFGTKLPTRDSFAPYAPYHYRAGRKIGGLNSGDGSFCSAQIKGMKEYGLLPCSTPGLVSDAFPEPQNTRTYREYGNSDAFLNNFAPVAKNFRLLESEKVRDAGTLKELITEHFKPVEICSMWAFTPDYTHPTWKLADGSPVVIYKRDRRTSWAHAMSLIGVVEHGGKWFAIVENSWGNAHRNGTWFAIPLDLADTWLGDAEAMSIGDIEMKDNFVTAA